jgi:hypothetical protein
MLLILLMPNRVTLSRWLLWLSVLATEQAIILTPEIVGRKDGDPDIPAYYEDAP